MTDLHLIYTDYGPDYGWSIQSPQIPELTGGRRTVEELVQDTDAILEFAGEDRRLHDDGVFTHEQHAVDSPNGTEYLVRFQSDAEGARFAAAAHVEHLCRNGLWTQEETDAQPRLVTTERLLIAVTADDKIGWVQDQLDDGGCASLAGYRDNTTVVILPFADGTLGARALCTLDGLGLGRDDTFGELVDAVIERELDELIVKEDIPTGDVESISHGLTSV